MSKIIIICACFLSVLCINESAKILGIFPSIGYSQYILGSALMKELASRGHQVTVISPFGQKDPIPNYIEIVVKDKVEFDADVNFYNLETLNVFKNVMVLYDGLGIPMTESILKDRKVQQLLHSKSTFDLVICEIFINEAHFAFAHHFNAPLIVFSSLGASEWSNHLIGNPSVFSHIPITFNSYNDHMNFWQRLHNTFSGLFEIICKHTYIYSKQNELVQKYFPNPPHLKDVIYNASLVLLNSNPAMNFVVPHVPNMIEIGGFHVTSKKLPTDLQDFLDKATDGVVYFSMGSNLKSSDLPQETKEGVFKALSKLKQKVLWKFEDENLPGKPANIKIDKWLPQRDILAHPNVRAFITHGGLISSIEAVYNGVPLIYIPVFGDQKMNSETAVANGYAVKISFSNLTEQSLTWALNEILTNPKYRETAQKRSKIFKDQPQKPIDTAMFWIEYVIRHGGAPHLRSSALDLTWYQYYLLDVVAFVLIATIGGFLVIRMTLRRIFKSDKSKKKEKKN